MILGADTMNLVRKNLNKTQMCVERQMYETTFCVDDLKATLLNKVLMTENIHCLLFSMCRGYNFERTEVFHSANSTSVLPNSIFFKIQTYHFKAKTSLEWCLIAFVFNKSIRKSRKPSLGISIINNAQKYLKVMKL